MRKPADQKADDAAAAFVTGRLGGVPDWRVTSPFVAVVDPRALAPVGEEPWSPSPPSS